MNETLPFVTWTITAGNILEILIITASVITLFNRMGSSIDLLRKDVTYIQEGQKALNEAFKQLSIILTKVAVQDTRMTMLERRVDELAHGKGIVS